MTRTVHKIIGLTLLLPFFGWIITAFVFYFKPGYTHAYEMLVPRTYPLASPTRIPADSSFMEAKLIRTVLGTHLCVLTVSGWTQLDPATLQRRPLPDSTRLRLLLEDAFSTNPDRYGTIVSIEGTAIRTSTGVRVHLDWDRMGFSQRGPDTDLIDWLYRIHYLQWTGIPVIDRILGPAGLLLVLTLCILGIRLVLQGSQPR